MPSAISPSVSADERLAIAARLHVLMRRIIGRVTDTDWMVKNDDYAFEMIRVARDHARRFNHPELAACADDLAHALSYSEAEDEPQTLFKRVALALRQKDAPALDRSAQSTE